MCCWYTLAAACAIMLDLNDAELMIVDYALQAQQNKILAEPTTQQSTQRPPGLFAAAQLEALAGFASAAAGTKYPICRIHSAQHAICAPVHDALAVAVVQRLEQQENVVADVVVAQHGVQHLEVLRTQISEVWWQLLVLGLSSL
jgi:hypothetical protein